MKSPASLRRVAEIRRLQEATQERAMQAAIALVSEANDSIATQEASLVDARSQGSVALAAGDRGEWLMTEAQAEVAGWNRIRLENLLQMRSLAVAPSTESFLQSRREHEQIKLLVHASEAAARAAEDRRAQSAADEWALSRHLRTSQATKRS